MPSASFFDRRRQQLVRRGVADELDERVEVAEGEAVGVVVGAQAAEAEVGGEPGAEAGHEHPLADVSQNFTTGAV